MSVDTAAITGLLRDAMAQNDALWGTSGNANLKADLICLDVIAARTGGTRSNAIAAEAIAEIRSEITHPVTPSGQIRTSAIFDPAIKVIDVKASHANLRKSCVA
nr:hypothetical protein [Mycolicibacterium psychrotolerans]